MSGTTTSFLEVRDLAVHFRVRKGLAASRAVKAVDGVSFDLMAGQTLGIAGESGSGKSTVARTLVRIVRPTGGTIAFDGGEIANLRGPASEALPDAGCRWFIRTPTTLSIPECPCSRSSPRLSRYVGCPGISTASEVEQLLRRVNLPASVASRHPGQLSGGQRQRVSIARALAVNPEIIICDEAVAALDVSIRAQILNLLKDIQSATGVGYLFISHDLSTLRFMADRVAIMYVGRIVEYGTSRGSAWRTRSTPIRRPSSPPSRALPRGAASASS